MSSDSLCAKWSLDRVWQTYPWIVKILAFKHLYYLEAACAEYLCVREKVVDRKKLFISASDLCLFCLCSGFSPLHRPVLTVKQLCSQISVFVLSLMNMHRFTEIIQCLLSCVVNCLCLHAFPCSYPDSLLHPFSSCRSSWLCCWKWDTSIEVKTRC